MNDLALSDDDLSFFRFTCDLFPSPESPLRYFDDDDMIPSDHEASYLSLKARGLLNDSDSGAAGDVGDRLLPVSECGGRVILRSSDATRRSFYMAGSFGVEYTRHVNGQHIFGALRSEGAVAADLVQAFVPRKGTVAPPLRLSAGDYLVFAVFARDVRDMVEPPDSDTNADAEAPMSVDEVLAFFDEPETNYVRTPSDDSWEESIRVLTEQGILVRVGTAYQLAKALHAFARELVADAQQTITRFDYLDQQWLVREVNIYPTNDAVYRLGTDTDGTVIIQELSTAALADIVAGVVSTLPNILNPEVPATLHGAVVLSQGFP